MSTFGTTTFNISVNDSSCRDALIARIESALSGEITNETLQSILVSLIECVNSGSSSTSGSDGVVTGVTISGNTITLTRSAGLPTITASVDISSNSTIVTINGNAVTLAGRVTDAENDIIALQAAITTLLTTVAVNNSLGGNGTVGSPLFVKLGAEGDNVAILGANGGVYVPPSGSSPNTVQYLADEAARTGLGSPAVDVIYTVLDSDGSNTRVSWTWDSSAWVRLNSPVSGAAGGMLVYLSGNLLVKASGLGITYGLAGNIGTVTIPDGVLVERLRINENYGSIGNNETFLLSIIDNNNDTNQSVATFDPFYPVVIERDVFAVSGLPDGSGSVFKFESGSMALSSRASVEIYEINPTLNKVVYRFQSLGTGTNWSILLS